MPTEPTKQNTLTRSDLDQWFRETIIYNLAPVLIVFLTSLYNAFAAHQTLPNGQDLLIAAGTAYGAFLAAMINLLSKYQRGN